jgi:hypothetical protein
MSLIYAIARGTNENLDTFALKMLEDNPELFTLYGLYFTLDNALSKA